MSENVDFHTRLIPKAHTALEDTASLLGLSRADVVNRAIQLYSFVEYERHAADADLAIVERDGAVHVLSFSDDAPELRERFTRRQVRRRPRPSWWPWKRGAS